MTPDKNYTIVKWTTPFLNMSTPTIQYGFGFPSENLAAPFNPDVIVPTDDLVRIHTLNATTLILVSAFGGPEDYQMYTYSKQ